MSQNYSDIIRSISEESGIKPSQVRNIADSIFDEIVYRTAKQGRVSIPRFGRFLVIETRSRKGHNPRTGEEIVVPSKKRIVFRVAKNTKDYVEENAISVDDFGDVCEE